MSEEGQILVDLTYLWCIKQDDKNCKVSKLSKLLALDYRNKHQGRREMEKSRGEQEVYRQKIRGIGHVGVVEVLFFSCTYIYK